MKRLMMKLMILSALLSVSAWSQCTGTPDPRVWSGTYAGGTTYALCNVVYYSGSAYVGIQAANTGHQPDTSISYWTLVYSAPVNLQSSDPLKGSHIMLDYNLAWLRANTAAATALDLKAPKDSPAFTGPATFAGPVSVGTTVLPASLPVSVLAYGADATGSLDSLAAFNAAKAAVPTTGCMAIPPGTYLLSAAFTQGACVEGVGHPRIKYSGSATIHALWVVPFSHDYRLSNVVFDGQGKTTNGVSLSSAIGTIVDRVRVTNVIDSGFLCEYCQLTIFTQPTVSNNVETFTGTHPANCFTLQGDSTANIIINVVCEGVTGSGLLLQGAGGNTFLGGTSEGNAIGIECNGTGGHSCSNNTFNGLDLEVNSTVDILVNGTDADYNLFTHITSGYLSTASIHVTDTAAGGGNPGGNTFDSGDYTASITIDPAAYLTHLSNFYAANCPTDNGYLSVMKNVQSGGTLCGDKTAWRQTFSVGIVTLETQYLSQAEGSCDAANRGRVVMVQGGAGVADTFRVCAKDASNNYAWTALY